MTFYLKGTTIPKKCNMQRNEILNRPKIPKYYNQVSLSDKWRQQISIDEKQRRPRTARDVCLGGIPTITNSPENRLPVLCHQTRVRRPKTVDMGQIARNRIHGIPDNDLRQKPLSEVSIRFTKVDTYNIVHVQDDVLGKLKNKWSKYNASQNSKDKC